MVKLNLTFFAPATNKFSRICKDELLTSKLIELICEKKSSEQPKLLAYCCLRDSGHLPKKNVYCVKGFFHILKQVNCILVIRLQYSHAHWGLFLKLLFIASKMILI